MLLLYCFFCFSRASVGCRFSLEPAKILLEPFEASGSFGQFSTQTLKDSFSSVSADRTITRIPGIFYIFRNPPEPSECREFPQPSELLESPGPSETPELYNPSDTLKYPEPPELLVPLETPRTLRTHRTLRCPRTISTFKKSPEPSVFLQPSEPS